MTTIRASALFAMMTLAVQPAPAMRQPAAEGIPSKDGMVVCTSAPACDAGAAILAKGGNAVDAAVATAFALAVSHPSAGNIGGGGFMVVRPRNGDATTFDYRERAPLKSTRTMYMRNGAVDMSLTNAGDLAANGGLITKEDLAAYEAKERTPVRGSFRGYDVVSMPPPSSGGVALIEMLNILEAYDLKSKGPNSAETRHLEIEAMRRAYLDRARYLGDPDFATMPLTKL